MWLGSHVAVAVVRPAATAPLRPLAWEPPDVVGAALEKTKRQKNKKRIIKNTLFCHIRRISNTSM